MLLALLGALFSSAASAAPDPTAGERSQLVVQANLTELDRYLEAGFVAVARTGSVIGGRLRPAGLRLLGMLALCSIAWSGLRHVLAGSEPNRLVGELVGQILLIAALYAALDRWGALMGVVEASFAQLGALAAGGALSTHEAAQGVLLVLDPAIAILGSAVRLPASILPTELVLWAAAFALKLAVVVVALVCGAIYAGMYLVCLCMLSIAVALGPVMLPWLLVGPLSFLFDGWLRFTLTAALYKLLGVVIITLAGSLREPIVAASVAAARGSSESLNLAAAAGALLLCVGLAFLMLQIPVIARALSSGKPWRSTGWF